MLKLISLFVSVLFTAGAPPLQDPEAIDAPEAFVKRHAGPDDQLDLEEARAALAELELQVVVQRDLAEADRRFAQLARRTLDGLEHDPSDAESREVYLLVQEAHIELRVARGMEPDFWHRPSSPNTAGSAAERELVVTLEELNSDPRIADWRARFDAQRESGAGQLAPFSTTIGLTPERDELAEAVIDALARGDQMLIHELGKRAAPTLARAVAEDLDFIGKQGLDPLEQLARADPAMAAATMRAHFDAGGALWRMRVLRTLYHMRQTWFTWGKLPLEDLVPGQMELWEQLALDPDLGTETLAKLPPAWSGALSPALIDTVVQGLDSNDRERRAAAAACLFGESASPVVVPIAESALESPHADVRGAAANLLARLPWSDALAARGDDPSGEVRRVVAQMFGLRRLNSYDATWVHRNERYAPPLDSESLVVLRGLLLDPDRAVRLQAANVLPKWPTELVNIELPSAGPDAGELEVVSVRRILSPPSAEELDVLARDPDEDVQENLIGLAASLAPDQGLAVLRILVASDDTRIARKVLQALPQSWYRTHPAEVLELVRAYRYWPEPTLGNMNQLQSQIGNHLIPLTATAAGLESVFRWAVAERGWVLEVVSGIYNIPAARLAQELAPSTYGAYLAGIDDGRHEDALGALLVIPAERMHEVYAALAADASRSSFLRALAALAAGRWRADGWQSDFLEALHDPFWSEDTTDGTSRYKRLEKAFAALPPARANALGLELVGDRAAQLRAADWLLGNAPLGAPGGEELALAIRERWSTSDPEYPGRKALHNVLKSMAKSPALRDDAYLALAVGDAYYANPVVETIRALRDPAHLPLLQRVLDEHRGTHLWGHTVREVLPSFLTDESAEMLLQAAALAENETTRKACLQNLESMRTYFLARDYWAERKQLRATQEVAIAELLALLDSETEAVRVHALRGLATFHAVESIPRMIRLLEDPSPAVANAAAEALEVLNRPEPVPAAGAADDN